MESVLIYSNGNDPQVKLFLSLYNSIKEFISSSKYKIDYVFTSDNLSIENIELIKKQNIEVNILEEDYIKNIGFSSNFHPLGKVAKPFFLKKSLESYSHDIIIYLDPDIIVQKDIINFINTLKKEEVFITKQFTDTIYLNNAVLRLLKVYRKLNLPKNNIFDFEYEINTGFFGGYRDEVVKLLDNWTKTILEKKYISLMNQDYNYSTSVNAWHDQDYFRFAIRNNIFSNIKFKVVAEETIVHLCGDDYNKVDYENNKFYLRSTSETPFFVHFAGGSHKYFFKICELYNLEYDYYNEEIIFYEFKAINIFKEFYFKIFKHKKSTMLDEQKEVYICGVNEYTNNWTQWCLRNGKKILAYIALSEEELDKKEFRGKPIIKFDDKSSNALFILSTISEEKATQLLNSFSEISDKNFIFCGNDIEMSLPLQKSRILHNTLHLIAGVKYNKLHSFKRLFDKVFYFKDYYKRKSNLKNIKNVYIFGVGEYAREWTRWCEKNNKNILAYVVSGQTKINLFLEKPVISKNDNLEMNTLFILSSVSSKSAKSMYLSLNQIPKEFILFTNELNSSRSEWKNNRNILDNSFNFFNSIKLNK